MIYVQNKSHDTRLHFTNKIGDIALQNVLLSKTLILCFRG